MYLGLTLYYQNLSVMRTGTLVLSWHCVHTYSPRAWEADV